MTSKPFLSGNIYCRSGALCNTEIMQTGAMFPLCLKTVERGCREELEKQYVNFYGNSQQRLLQGNE
jgi:hypothetical protein